MFDAMRVIPPRNRANRPRLRPGDQVFPQLPALCQLESPPPDLWRVHENEFLPGDGYPRLPGHLELLRTDGVSRSPPVQSVTGASWTPTRASMITRS